MIRARIRKLWLRLRLREQLLLLLLIGGLIPLVISNLWTYISSQDVLVEKAQKDESAYLTLIRQSMEDSAGVLSSLSRQLYFQEALEHIAFTEYTDYAEILRDYREITVLTEFQELYYRDVMHITLYVDNPTISNNEHFIWAEEEIQKQAWYQETLALKGLPCWDWVYDSYSRNNCLRMSRVIYTRDQRQVGVVSLVLQNKRTELPIRQREESTLLLARDGTVLHANTVWNEEDLEALADLEEGTAIIPWQGENCLATVQFVSPDYAFHAYTLISLIPYREITGSARIASLQSLLPQFLCVMAAIVLIVIFSWFFDRRIRRFQAEMHRAARGDFNLPEEVEGQDEIADLYRDLRVMVTDIQRMTADIIEKQTAEEKLNARQKESQLKMLTSQINPHFLFNTLETIRMQAVVRKEKEIADLTKMLARILRRSIQTASALQSVHSEMQLIRDYLTIQDYRFHDRMRYEMEEDESTSNWLMMPLLIQPLAENAIIHGLKEVQKGGIIRVTTRAVYAAMAGEKPKGNPEEDLCLLVTVSDNGPGMSAAELAELKERLLTEEDSAEHIGLSNVSQRIRLKYGAPYGLEIESEPGQGTRVTLTLPVIRQGEEYETLLPPERKQEARE